MKIIYQTIGEICDGLKISEGTFYLYLALGMPAVKINGQWHSNYNSILNWHDAALMKKKPKVINLDAAELKKKIEQLKNS